jgi:hypothetical protein
MAFNPFSRLVLAWKDLRFFFATRERYEYLCALAAIAVGAFVVFGFWHDSRFEQQEQIIYVNNWPANRSDAEIEKEIKADSAERHKLKAERQAEFQKIDNAMDRFGLH